MSNPLSQIKSKGRCTFAIISHPDAGKTTITEKLLLFAGAIQMAGSVKSRKSTKHATSDWMELEKQRGISVTTSVMQFEYQSRLINLLDTPGHEDFSEDTYRTLTAVDSALMVIDAVKGVEERTIKLIQVCRLRTTPIITFINKLDRDSQEPLSLLDNIENTLDIKCAPMTWPMGMGKHFKGVYQFATDSVLLFKSGQNERLQAGDLIQGLDHPKLDAIFGSDLELIRQEIELVRAASHEFSQAEYLAGSLTPVYFGSALNNFGIRELLDAFAKYSPLPTERITETRMVSPDEAAFSGFVFKIQANMDPQHRDRIAFLRICSGHYQKGMKVFQSRTGKTIQLNNALTFMAGDRDIAFTASYGDIIGLHNHGTIQIGDTFTEGESLKFKGIPYFAPELFRAVRAKDPLKAKALQKGLDQLSEEGATQIFRPLLGNRIILGAVGVLQFDVVAHRLLSEYKVDAIYEEVSIATVRWISTEDESLLPEFISKCQPQLAYDSGNNLSYLAPSYVNLELTAERWPQLQFKTTREH